MAPPSAGAGMAPYSAGAGMAPYSAGAGMAPYSAGAGLSMGENPLVRLFAGKAGVAEELVGGARGGATRPYAEEEKRKCENRTGRMSSS